MGAPKSPQPPFARRPPPKPRPASLIITVDRAPEIAPYPPSLVAPRQSRGAPRSSSQVNGGPEIAPTPLRSSPPAKAPARLAHHHGRSGPRNRPIPPFARRAPAKPRRASIIVAGEWGPRY